MIKAVIFDLGGVLHEWTNDITYRYISERFGVEFDVVKTKLKQLLPSLQTGKITEKEFWERFFSSMHMELPEDYEELWAKKYKEKAILDSEIVELLKRLKAKYKLALLSNNEPSHVACERERGFFEYFSLVILSFEVGLRKPDERIYKLTLDKLGLKAEKCIFIDNKEINLIPAQRLGIKTILFKNSEQLKDELKKCGVHGI